MRRATKPNIIPRRFRFPPVQAGTITVRTRNAHNRSVVSEKYTLYREEEPPRKKRREGVDLGDTSDPVDVPRNAEQFDHSTSGDHVGDDSARATHTPPSRLEEAQPASSSENTAWSDVSPQKERRARKAKKKTVSSQFTYSENDVEDPHRRR